MRLVRILFSGLLFLRAMPVESAQITIHADVNLVQLSVRVTDKNGRNVVGLSRDAFRLMIDGKEQPITVFNGEDGPVTAGIVIDNSASMEPKRAEVIAAAMAFARASNTRDQMFVVHFNERARLGLPERTPFTGKIKELETAISSFDVGGSTALYDAILLAQSHIRGGVYGRRILLVITDGGDNSSKATLEEAVDAVAKAGVVIYAIGIYDPNDKDQNPKVLAHLAEVTGGEAFFPTALSDITRICEEIAADVRRQYTIGFAGADDNMYHQIEVIASDPKHGELQVHTRPSYFASKPRSSANRMQTKRKARKKK
uniref:von Willebrand factor, type A n=1 Tax=Solibacter usitatus (strain Ellin6076) TaxID=234267 RepID=Q021M1_SOLUE